MPHRYLPNSVLGALIRELSVGVVIFEPVYDNDVLIDLKYVYLNDLAAKLSGGSIEEIVGLGMLERQPSLAQADLLTRYEHVLLTNEATEFEQFIPAEQSLFDKDAWYSMKAQRYDNFIVLLFDDISKRKKLESHIKRMAFQDELTGVYNRRYFVSRVPQLLSLAKRMDWCCGLLYFDLNGFKDVNDSLGHSMGDRLLKALAWRLSRLSRKQDIFFRSGGDEFALFLPEATVESALGAAERIAKIFDTPINLEGHTLKVGASIGIAVAPASTTDMDSLLEQADSAMYAAKERKSVEHVPIELVSQ